MCKNIFFKWTAIVMTFIILGFTNAYSQNVINNAGGVNWRMGGNNLSATGSTVFGTFAPLAQPIFIYSNGFERMLINNLGNGNNDGQIAMGNNLPVGFTPTARLHLHQDGGNNFMRYSTNTTGSGALNGFATGINNNGFAFITNFTPNQPTAFFTNNVPNGPAFERMRISANDFNGFITMGNTANFNPASELHINTLGLLPGGLGAIAYGHLFRTDGLQTIRNEWQMFNGPNNNSLNEIGVIFTDPQTSSQLFANQPQYNHLNIQATQGDIILRANGYNLAGPGPNPTEVVRITRTQYQQPNAGAPANEGRVSITRSSGLGAGIVTPLAMLHIGDQFVVGPPYNNPNGVGGWRPWMDVGTYYDYQTDNMYVGIKPTTVNDVSDAVIDWGNNPSNIGNGDRMKFIFTAAAGNGNASGPNGLEVARMWSDGTEGRTGFGGGAPFNNAFTIVATNDPGNTVEINSANAVGASAPNAGGGTGFSGLRFTDLNSTSTPYTTNPSTGFLSVDANGDVILVPGSSGGGLGAGYCNALTPLVGNSAGYNLNAFNFYFDGNGSTNIAQNDFIIGNGCGYVPRAKLDINQSSASVGTGSIAVLSGNTDASGGSFLTSAIGVKSIVAANGNDIYRIAGWFQAQEPGGINTTAIFVPKDGGHVSIGYATPNANTPGMLEVSGNIYMGGLLVATSDQSWKINVTPINGAINKIRNINGIYYNWDTINYPNMNFESARQVGFIAQNVDSILPEVVRTDDAGKEYLAYDRIVALLVEGAKEEDQKVDSLIQTVAALENQLNSCCSANANARMQQNNFVNQTDVTLTNEDAVVLNNNVPNPFAEQTTIAYHLPDNIQKAQMLFYDATGKLIKAVELTARGDGQLNIFADDLSNGIYTYALVADGKIVDTKKMVKAK